MNAAIATPLQILHTPKEAADWLRAHAGSLQTDSRLLQLQIRINPLTVPVTSLYSSLGS